MGAHVLKVWKNRWKNRISYKVGNFRPYEKIMFPNEVTGFIRNDHTNFKVIKAFLSKRKLYNRYVLGKNFYKRNKYLRRQIHPTWLGTRVDSFNQASVFFFKKNRWYFYQKAAPYHYANKYFPRSSWKSKLYEEEVKYLRQIWLTYLAKLYGYKLSNIELSKERRNFKQVISKKRLPENYKFIFVTPKPLKASLAKGFFFWRTSLQHNRHAFGKKIKRNFSIGYKPIRKRKYMISSTNKSWKRLIEKPIRKYLGNKTIGDIRYLSGKTKHDHFSKNTSGFKMKLDSDLEFTISSIIFKLKIAPSQSIAYNFVRSGLVTVNNRVLVNVNSKVHPYDTIKYKGDWFRNYLMIILHDEDKSFERFPKNFFAKNSLRFMSRFWPPSYLEISFKLQEAVILRKNFIYEQASPYVMKRTNIPTFLRTRFEKKGMGLF